MASPTTRRASSFQLESLVQVPASFWNVGSMQHSGCDRELRLVDGSDQLVERVVGF
jgi:hypothetical protein